MPVTIEDAIQEIRLRMPSVANAGIYHGICGKAGNFLSDTKRVTECLIRLEAAMRREAEMRLTSGLNVNEVVNLVGKPRDPGVKLPSYLQNLLSTVLVRTELQNGFALGEKQRSWASANQPAGLTLTGFVPPDQFRQVLVSRRPFKDPTVPGGHGEYSHRIQWYCLMQTDILEGTGLSWSDFYSWVGTIKHERSEQDDKPKWSDLGLWDALFDRDAYDQTRRNGPYDTDKMPLDFRSPNNLQEALARPGEVSEQCALLTAFLTARALKRNTSNVTISEKAVAQYVTKKLFGVGVSYDSLSSSDKRKVQVVLDGKEYAPGSIMQQASDCIIS